MILGMGSDMVDIRRIEKSLERFGDKFIQRVFSDEEIKKAKRRKDAGIKVYAGTLAKRFAAKEACSKALGTGFQQGVYMKDISVGNHVSGKPKLTLTNGAHVALMLLSKNGTAPQVELTMTDEYPYAQAMVIIASAE